MADRKKLHPPFPWYGGKFTHLPVLLQHIPPHRTYVEVFGGSAALLLNKDPSEIEVYNDIDSGATNFFRVLRDNEAELIRRLILTPYSREEYNLCRKNWSTCEDPVERARMWYFVASSSFIGRFGHGFAVSATDSSNGMSSCVNGYLNRIQNLWKVASRLRTVIIENLDFREVIRRYDTPDTLFYLDPPYHPDTRATDDPYVHELSRSDHEALVDILLGIKGKAMLSGYDNEVYKRLEKAGWRKIIYTMRSTSAMGKASARKREECLWLSPNC